MKLVLMILLRVVIAAERPGGMPAGDGHALFGPARASSRTRLPVEMQGACQLTSSMHVNQHACQDEAENNTIGPLPVSV
jgi:hypothetical protein